MELIPIEGIPEVRPGDVRLSDWDLGGRQRRPDTQLRDGDVIVVTQKVVSKAENRLVAVNPEIAGAAEMVMGKEAGIAAAIVRGVNPLWLREGSVHDEVVRSPGEDLFRQDLFRQDLFR